MRRIKIRKPSVPIEYQNDTLRIMEACEELGFSIPYSDAYEAWSQYSESVCAGWLILPQENENIYNCISPYIEEE